MKMPVAKTGFQNTKQLYGFTRMELLVVVLVTGVLFLLGTSAQANFNRQSRAAICISNLKQLTTGWILYADDHAGILPLNNTSLPVGSNWAHGWLDFTASADNTNTAYLVERQYATLGPYTRNVTLYRCPDDPSRTPIFRGRSSPRVRSYAMNGCIGSGENAFDTTGSYRTYRYMSDVINPLPENMSVFYDAHPESMNDIVFKINPRIGSGAQIIDYPAPWHNRGGTVSFADGHVVINRWQDYRTVLLVPAGFFSRGNSPNNPDVQWISEHSTSLRN